MRHNRETASFSPTPTVTAGETGEERRGESRGQERKQSSEKLLLEKQLLEQHPEALDALRVLVDGAALTEEARLSASAALAAVEGPLPGPAPTPGDEKHVMMSCALLSIHLQLWEKTDSVPCAAQTNGTCK